MAPKLLLSFVLLSLLSTISITSSPVPDSIAAAPSSSLKSRYGRFNLQVLSSFLSLQFNIGFTGLRKLATGSARGRSVAEIGSNTTREVNGTRGAMAPALAPAPAPASGKQKPVAEEKKKEKSGAVKWLLGMVVGVATGALSAVVASFGFRVIQDFVKRPKPSKPLVFQRKVINAKALALLESAGSTDSLELLGKGGSGEVYKTTLENGTVVAIKKILSVANLTKGGGVDPELESSYDLTKHSAQIKAELDTLGQIRHRNLVTLLAYIPLQNAHLLVYDYMENGSLHDVLMKVAEDTLELPWEKRFNIAKGVAMGLKYLHFDSSPKIVHCDLKPGNILLDKDMVPHIGDFGLAKLIPDSFTHFTSKNMAGTVGYMPPEYHQVCRYTTKGDVYGFGVCLVVLLTGKEPTHHLFSDVYTHVGNWLGNIFASGEASTLDVLDPHLRGQGDEAEMLLTLKIAAFCLHENPEHRPTSNDILKMLGQIRGAA